MRQVRVFPADVYDALHFSALAFGGIGNGHMWENSILAPCCILGHAIAVDPTGWRAYKVVIDILGAGAVGVGELNDSVVPLNKRISFLEWCRRLNIVRGES